ncbi:MAG: fused MFS/spermidine synthase [Planctomycetota bacterium]
MVYVLYLLSGIAALLYQVVWTKELSHQFGVTAYAVGTTLAVFMLGLATGSLVLGRVADRVRRPLVAYAWIEGGIALGALGSRAALRAVEGWVASLDLASADGATLTAVRALGTALVLAVPTILMGGTLPVLVKAAVARGGAPGRAVGRLYAVNALGGAAGCLLAGFVTIGALGLDGSLRVGVALNLVAAVGALALARRRGAAATPPAADAAVPRAVPDARPVGAAMRTAFLVAGVVGLGVEVAWTRLLMMNLDSTAQSFAAVVAVCLVGLGLGSAAAARLADRVEPVRAYAVATALVGVALLASAGLWAAFAPRSGDAARWVLARLPAAAGGNAAFRLVVALVQCALLVLGPTFLMGCSFPFAGRAFARDPGEVGRRLGAAVTLNTLGCTLGPLLCGFWWLPSFGVQASLALCASLALVAGAGLLATTTRPAARAAVAVAAVAVLAFAWTRAPGTLVAGTEQRSGGRLLHAEEDVCGSVAVLEVESGGERCRQLKVGTTSMITDALGCRRYTRLLGHLPALLHPAPRDALVICLGSGMTLSAVAAHPDIATIDCVELSPAVVRAARRFFGEANGAVLDDPRVRVVVNDGRTHLLHGRKAYDLIALEPPPPYDDGVASLYAREFYELCRDRLREGGMVAQWIPYHCITQPQLRSLLATVRAVFPDATLWELFDGREYAVIGRRGGGPVPLERLAARFAEPRVRAHLEPVGIRHVEDLLACHVLGPDGLAAFTDGAPLVTDDRPGIGYDLAARDALPLEFSWAFQAEIQAAGLATAAHATPVARLLAFPDAAAEAAFAKRLAPVHEAAEMHRLALRLCTLRAARHPEVFAARFASPVALDPTNPYYRYAERRGVYARARMRREREGGGW